MGERAHCLQAYLCVFFLRQRLKSSDTGRLSLYFVSIALHKTSWGRPRMARLWPEKACHAGYFNKQSWSFTCKCPTNAEFYFVSYSSS